MIREIAHSRRVRANSFGAELALANQGIGLWRGIAYRSSVSRGAASRVFRRERQRCQREHQHGDDQQENDNSGDSPHMPTSLSRATFRC